MLYWNVNSKAVTIYYHMCLHQYSKYLEIDLIGSKTTNQKQAILFHFFLPRRDQTQDLSVPSLLPSHLSRHTSTGKIKVGVDKVLP